MDLSTIHILTFTSQNLLNDIVNDLTIVPDKDILGIWMGECHEDPGLTCCWSSSGYAHWQM